MKKKCENGEFLIKKRLSKTLLTMKFTLLLFLLTTVQVFGTAYSQATKLSVEMQEATLVEILDNIENQSDFKFLYNNDLLENENHDIVDFRDKTVEQILDKLLDGTGSKYSVLENNLIVISPTDNIAQQKTISGKITDENGEPLTGATVVVKGTTNGTVTDMNGNYTLQNITDEDVVLIVSFIGYSSKEVIADGTTMDVVLQEDIVGLDEVVVVGYGAVKKSDLTGSVSQVKSEDIAAYPTLGVSQAIQGRAAGVQVQSNNGEPGAGVKIRIRGGTSINSSSDPLYVVDGFPGGTLPPPEDIESIEILKDASATAIYGSRGANGVIMVTTKRGTAGKTLIELNTSYSVQNEINRFDLLNATQMAEYINETQINSGIEPSNVSYPNPQSYGVGTDWQEEIFQPGGIQNYQLSLSGGNENVKYYVSGVVYDQTGIVISSDFKRYSVTSNLDLVASDKLTFGINMFASRSIKNGVRTQENSGGSNNAGVISAAFKFEPTQPVYDEEGNYTLATLNDPHDNPVALATELVNEDVADRLQSNFYGEYFFTPELKLRVMLGANIYNSRNGDYTPTTLNAARNRGGLGAINANKNTNLINENYLTYSKDWNNQSLSVMGGYSYQSFENSNWRARAAGFITDAGLFWNLGQGAELQTPSSGITSSELSSFYGRLNYKLLDRYMFTLNARYDGSSRFAKNNKWAFFPSGAFAWNVTEESFMQDVETIDQLKLRASYGITGNQAIGAYQSLAKFGSVLTIIDGDIVNAVRPTTVANENLTWESTAQTNIGADVGLFDLRLLLSADYYYMVTSDLLFSQPLPQYSGYGSLLSNIGKVENKGFELSVISRNIDGKLQWDTEFNISTNKNKVLELPNGNDIFYNAGPGHMVGLGSTGVLREGSPVGSFYGYTYLGVLQSDSEALPGNPEQEAGGEQFADISGFDDEGDQDFIPDGTINSADRDIIGNPHPDFIWGLNNTFMYGDFDLNIFFQGSQGNDLYSFSLMELDLMSGQNNATTAALNRWSVNNTNTNIPKAKPRARISSTRWVYDGSYVRLKNIALGYNFNRSLLSRIGLSKLRVYVSAQNLLTFTKYVGYDPEVNWRTGGSTNSNRNLGLDYGSYPNVKSVTLGINIGF